MRKKPFIYFTNREWDTLILTKELSVEFLTKYASFFNDEHWTLICKHQSLSGDFIISFFSELPKDILCMNQKIHEDLVEKNFQTFMPYMDHVVKHVFLTEKFLNKHKRNLNWNQVFKYQANLSLPFIKKHFRYLGKVFVNPEPTTMFCQPTILNIGTKALIDVANDHNLKVSRIKNIKASSPPKRKRS